MNKKRQNLIALVGILSIAFITVGVSLAFFNYAKTGTDDNAISTGSITFIYDEESGQGRGITLTDAMPISNALGKAEQANVFNFRITSTPGNTNIKYTVTARKVSDGNTLDDVVDLYLTDQTNNGNYIADQYPSKITQEKTILTFDDLDGYKNSSIEKILYEKTITSSDLTNGKYEQDFRLRMWIDENTDFSDGTYNNQLFRIIVNVNANVDTSIVSNNNNEEEVLPNNSLRKLVLDNYGGAEAIEATPTSSTDTILATEDDDGETYYFNGAIEDNYVDFAGHLWRIMRINGDGTIRMIIDGAMNTEDGSQNFATSILANNVSTGSQEVDINNLYYQNLSGRQTVDTWYNNTIDTYIEGNSGTKYSDYVATGKYCEATKVTTENMTPLASISGNNKVVYDSNYTLTYTCETDSFGHDYFYSKIALPTFEDLLFAGANFNDGHKSYYINNGAGAEDCHYLWTMSASGIAYPTPTFWMALVNGISTQVVTSGTAPIRPVINLKSNVEATGTGSKSNPFVVTGLYENGENMIRFAGQNVGIGTTEMPIKEGESIKISVKPNNEYYLSSVTCTTGYTATASTGTSATGRQKVTVTRNNANSAGECVFTATEMTYSLKNKILADNQLIESTPTLTSTSNNNTSGLYSETVTSGFGGQSTEGTTYYFRGNVTNNYVDFANLTWRIVRINEDGSVRLILDDDNVTLSSALNANKTTENDLYYSSGTTSGTAKYDLETWYTNNIASNDPNHYVLTGNYYCEQPKKGIAYPFINPTLGITLYSDSPTIDLNCNKLVNSNIGLITYEEGVYAGLYPTQVSNSYLVKDYNYLTMSPAGFYSGSAYNWYFYYESSSTNALTVTNTNVSNRLRPVINLDKDTQISIDPTTHHYVVK